MSLVSLFYSWFARPGQCRALVVGGCRRRYYVHLPPGHDPGSPAPVVLALHGATMNGPMMAGFTGLNAKADAAGFVVVYPDGTGSLASYFWNGGPDTGPAARNGVDDVGFVRAVLEDLPRVALIDPRRVFIIGLSNGGFMAYRLAAELSDKVAAVCCVAGTLGAIDCRPTRPVPVLHVHGTEDEFVPFAGGRGRRSLIGSDYRSVRDAVRTWAKLNGCHPEPVTEQRPDEARDGTTVTRETYGGGRDGAEVVLVVVRGGGHTWPGRAAAGNTLGRTTRNVSANDLMWDFFRRHPMP